MTVRVFVPGPATNTIVPLSVSVPLVAAAAGMAGAAEIASAVPAAQGSGVFRSYPVLCGM
jgi:hypothetical protein